MNIDAKKINALIGSWSDKSYHNKVSPQFDEANIPTFRQEVLSLTQLHNDRYWSTLRAGHKIDIAVPDYHHWWYDDKVFEEYLARIASVKFPVVCLAEDPFGFEMPEIEPSVFAEKLFERTVKLATVIRTAHPETVVLSPGIGLISEKHAPLYLDYFIRNRQHFDGYALHLCNDIREHSLARVSTFLNQVMETLPKPVWVLKWAVPCSEGKIINPQVIGPVDWEPYQPKEAVGKLKRTFAFFETLAAVGSYWFYTGTGKDIYKPRRKVGPYEFWLPPQSCFTSQEYTYTWDVRHFLGLINADGVVKHQLLQGILDLVRNNRK